MKDTKDFAEALKHLLRQMVYLQDRGKFDCDVLSRAGVTVSFMDQLGSHSHIERLRMHAEGLDVYVPLENLGFTLGLDPWPYKTTPIPGTDELSTEPTLTVPPPTVCEHEWYPDGPGQEHCPKCNQSRPCA